MFKPALAAINTLPDMLQLVVSSSEVTRQFYSLSSEITLSLLFQLTTS